MAFPPKQYVRCEDCGGSGKSSGGTACQRCKGTGKLWTTGQRRFLRYLTNLHLTVSLSERHVNGYCNQIAEGGLGALLEEPVSEGCSVSLRFAVPTHPTALHMRGIVRYVYGFQHGIEFVFLEEEERLAIRRFCTGLSSVSAARRVWPVQLLGLANQRRSTRVPLRVTIETSGAESATCEGETVIVNLHGALIRSSAALSVGQKIQLEVFITGKKVEGEVIWSDPEKPLTYGVALVPPQNVWGVPLPPGDWYEEDELCDGS